MTMIFGVPLMVFMGQLMLGLINGAFYALLSLGLAVIFGLLKIVNFAHGAMYMLGAFATLLGLQLDATYPLLRITALHALPPDPRLRALRGTERMALRFAGMISDGTADGSIRPVDPMIASQGLAVMLNGASDVHAWARALPLSPERAVEIYASTLAFGMFRAPAAAA